MSGAHSGEKRTMDSLEPEFQNVVSAHVDARTEPGPLHEQPVLLTPEPHRHLSNTHFLKLLYYRKAFNFFKVNLHYIKIFNLNSEKF